MISATENDWRSLFDEAPAERSALTLRFGLVRRGGEPFLILPSEPGVAARALVLYPAQTLKARLAKAVLTGALRLGLAHGLETVSLRLEDDDPFVRFLCEAAGTPPSLLRLGALAGNPRTPGRRFVFLLFDASGQPTAVVKAGNSDAARRLLSHEENFLRSVPPQMRGLPRLRAALHTSRVQAFAMDFVPGRAARAGEVRPLASLLEGWLSRSGPIPLGELEAWRRLMATRAEVALPESVRALESWPVHPTLAHGDCAPWNAKVRRGQWTFLDWERGELAGVPGWDWLHFVLQPALLVRRESVSRLLARLEATLQSEAFADYARQAGIVGRERALALALLCYINRVIRPADGAVTLKALEQAATERWG